MEIADKKVFMGTTGYSSAIFYQSPEQKAFAAKRKAS